MNLVMSDELIDTTLEETDELKFVTFVCIC